MLINAEKVLFSSDGITIQSNKTKIKICICKDENWKIEMVTPPHTVLSIGKDLDKIVSSIIEKTKGTKWEYPNIGHKTVRIYDYGVEL